MKFLLALLAAGKFSKLAVSGGTMLVSLAVYAAAFGWAYAAGFVALIAIHELGHYISARQHGLAVGLPIFIPFVGAWITLRTEAMEPRAVAHVALAGPVLGTFAAFLCYLYALHAEDRFWYALSYTGFLINLFNLIPLRPLDGGRILGVVSQRVWILGLPLMVAVFFWTPNPLILLILLLAIPDVWAALRGGAGPAPVVCAAGVRVTYGAAYLVLAAALAVMTYHVHETLGN